MSEQTEAREALDAATQYAWTHGDSQTAKDFLAGVEWQSARSPLTAPSEVEREAGQVPLDALLVVYRDGEERGWQAEFDFLWSEHQERMDFLATSIQETGIRAPILLGSDGRVWDGHHRLAAAHRLGLPTVPVEFASRPTPPEDAEDVVKTLIAHSTLGAGLTLTPRDVDRLVLALRPATPPEDAVDIERLCEIMHDAYEAAAVGAGWETQERSRKPWVDVPEPNKVAMRAAVRSLVAAFATQQNPASESSSERPFSELRSTGLLWLINRVVFHPRGFAIALVADGDRVVGWEMLGDGSKPWSFEDESANFVKVEAFLAALADRPLPETEEWEYGVRSTYDGSVSFGVLTPEAFKKYGNGVTTVEGVSYPRELVRRRPAGPWSPVPSADLGEEDGR